MLKDFLLGWMPAAIASVANVSCAFVIFLLFCKMIFLFYPKSVNHSPQPSPEPEDGAPPSDPYGRILLRWFCMITQGWVDNWPVYFREYDCGLVVVISGNQNIQADKSGDLDSMEVFKLEHFVSVVRREYVESYESGIPPSVMERQLKKAISARGSNHTAIQGRHILSVSRDHCFLCLNRI